jgi:prolyl 4-hydroxylase
MGVMDEAQALAKAGRGAEAKRHVERAAASGDPEALLALANWRLFGLYGPRDLAEAHRLLGRAAAAGDTDAVRMQATLIGNGTGCRADPARAARLLGSIAGVDSFAAFQLAFLAKMMRLDQANALPSEVLSKDPPVRLIRGLLLPEESSYLMTLSEPRLEPSFIIDPSGARRPHPTRTSSGTSFGPLDEDLVVRAINSRIAALTGTDVAWGEPLHILRYEPGQEYRPHLDTLPGVSNQRGWTMLIYLNADYDGGETAFDRLGVVAKGGPGDGLLFRSIDAAGRPDERTRHAGLPVRSGTKWLATRWIRQGPYHPWTSP